MNESVELVYKSDMPADRIMPLDVTLKSQFERVFGADLSNVKIHIGHNADQVAREHGAYAVAIGTDIYFSNGQYSPETIGGIKLLAHEMQHVVQFLNDRSVTYNEDVAALESEAHEIEQIFDDLSLENVDGPLIDQSEISQLDQTAAASASTVGLKKSVNNYDEVRGTDTFKQKRILKEITVVLESFNMPAFSASEYLELQQALKEKIVNYFYEKKQTVTSEEWEEFVIKFFRFLRK